VSPGAATREGETRAANFTEERGPTKGGPGEELIGGRGKGSTYISTYERRISESKSLRS